MEITIGVRTNCARVAVVSVFNTFIHICIKVKTEIYRDVLNIDALKLKSLGIRHFHFLEMFSLFLERNQTKLMTNGSLKEVEGQQQRQQHCSNKNKKLPEK